MTTGRRRSRLSATRRTVLGMLPLALGGLAVGRVTAAARLSGELRAERAAAAPARADGSPFPLALEPGRRHLVDAAGAPFLIHGDTAWSLIAELTPDEVDLYLGDRRARGFNTLLVSLIESYYAANAPANAAGERPFHSRPFELLASLDDLLPWVTFADFSAPNDAYFAHADWVLRRAAEEGFLVLLTPAYIGCCADGWYQAMAANGTERLRSYGEYLGRRYRDFTNILWVHGGDDDPPRQELVSAIAEGIRQHDPRALHTAHGSPDTAVAEFWHDAGWLQVNNVYTYGPVHAPALEQYRRPDRMPFFLIESAYENEHEATEQRLRTQAYQAILSGAAGQVFGNNPIWHFDGGGVYPAPVTWREALDSRGAASMAHLRALLDSVRWWELEPDLEQRLLTAGLGPADDRAVAARAADRSFALLYLPSRREITVDLGELAGNAVAARWYDPASGAFSAVAGAPFPTGPRRFGPQAVNSAGFEDWVLLLDASA